MPTLMRCVSTTAKVVDRPIAGAVRARVVGLFFGPILDRAVAYSSEYSLSIVIAYSS